MYECCTSTSVTYWYEFIYRWDQQPCTPSCILHMLTVIYHLCFLRIAAATERKANRKKTRINIVDWNWMTYTSHFPLLGRSSPNARQYAMNWARYVILKTFPIPRYRFQEGNFWALRKCTDILLPFFSDFVLLSNLFRIHVPDKIILCLAKHDLLRAQRSYFDQFISFPPFFFFFRSFKPPHLQFQRSCHLLLIVILTIDEWNF